MKAYKLTDQNLQTRNGFQWTISEWQKTDGSGQLCSAGWLHAYEDPLLAVLLNPYHGNLQNPRLWEVEVAGKSMDDEGLKCGFTKMRLVKELPLPVVSPIQRIAFGILCVLAVYNDPEWRHWAEDWLDNKDRTVTRAITVQHIVDEGDTSAADAASWVTAAARDWSKNNIIRIHVASAVVRAATSAGIYNRDDWPGTMLLCALHAMEY
jgi:hypothetical protein